MTALIFEKTRHVASWAWNLDSSADVICQGDMPVRIRGWMTLAHHMLGHRRK
jgi:hypothetical protein